MKNHNPSQFSTKSMLLVHAHRYAVMQVMFQGKTKKHPTIKITAQHHKSKSILPSKCPIESTQSKTLVIKS